MRSDAYTRSAEPRTATEAIPGTVANHTGGRVFTLDALARARRFLITGTTGGTYYQSERDLTRENALASTGLLIQHALKHKIPVDTFVVITDNEVNTGLHVPDLLRKYRRKTGIDARLAVLAVTSTGFTIADPTDPGMLDIAGFGADVPAVLEAFSGGAM